MWWTLPGDLYRCCTSATLLQLTLPGSGAGCAWFDYVPVLPGSVLEACSFTGYGVKPWPGTLPPSVGLRVCVAQLPPCFIKEPPLGCLAGGTSRVRMRRNTTERREREGKSSMALHSEVSSGYIDSSLSVVSKEMKMHASTFNSIQRKEGVKLHRSVAFFSQWSCSGTENSRSHPHPPLLPSSISSPPPITCFLCTVLFRDIWTILCGGGSIYCAALLSAAMPTAAECTKIPAANQPEASGYSKIHLEMTTFNRH